MRKIPLQSSYGNQMSPALQVLTVAQHVNESWSQPVRQRSYWAQNGHPLCRHEANQLRNPLCLRIRRPVLQNLR